MSAALQNVLRPTPAGDARSGGAARPLAILSLSCVFPGPGRPELGAFVRFRLQALARHARVTVVSPAGLLDWSHPSGSVLGNRNLPARTRDGALDVLYPRWAYPPGGGAINARLLAWQMAPRLRRLGREHPFDLIDAHFGYPDGIAAAILARSLGKPYVITLRGNETMHAASPDVRREMARALAGAARVIAVSRPLGDFALSLGAAPDRLRFIPNGIDASIFHPRDRAAARRRFSIPEGRRAILSAGSLIERKGHHRVVRALGTLHDISAELLIAGGPGREGRYEREIRQTVAELGLAGRVRFLGHLDAPALAQAMSAADVFCLASSREGWPNVVHEAMACGAPVVASQAGGIADMVPSADFGTVVPAGDGDALAAALGRALATAWDREAISRWGMARDWDQVAREVLAEFAAVAAASNLGGIA